MSRILASSLAVWRDARAANVVLRRRRRELPDEVWATPAEEGNVAAVPRSRIRARAKTLNSSLASAPISRALLFVSLLAGCAQQPPREPTARPTPAAAPTRPAVAPTPSTPPGPVRPPPRAELAPAPPEPPTPRPERPKEPVRLDAGIRAALPNAIATSPYPDLLSALYRRRGGDALFHKGRALNENARDLLALVEELPTHALDPGPFDLGHAWRDGSPRAVRALALKPLDSAEAAAKRDVRLASALLRYVLEFRFYRRAHPFRYTRDESDLIARHRDAIVRTGAGAFPNLRTALEALWPRHPDYQRVRAALPRYRALAARGPTPRVKTRRRRPLERGARGALVESIQRRLAFEGYYDGPITRTLDATTAAAVVRFQRNHHLDADGRPGRATFDALDVSMKTRLRQLELALQRWRESLPARHSATDYLHVNLAGYSLQLYEGGRPLRQHRVIIGSNKLDFSRRDWLQGHLNRTPFLHTRMYRLVLNPVWIVPQRLRDEEYAPADAKRPGYLARKGISEVAHGGSTVLVQSSGAHNVLGQVKFLLERTNAIYLHDTNRRRLFDNTARALSHGCVRVDQALDLAKHIARDRGGLSPERFDAVLSNRRPYNLNLARPLTVYTEYNTVTFGADGRLIFLPDVYGYDRAWLRGQLPPRVKVRFGSVYLKPRKVPRIPVENYRALKRKGGLAPLEWPPSTTGPEG